MRETTVERFRARLQAVIERSGLSRSAFAARAGVNRSTLSQILSPATDRLPRVETLIAIARAEQVSIDWLVGLSQEGGLKADLMSHTLELATGGPSPLDACLATWRAEATGYKIRYVPVTLPDLLKTPDMIVYEYSGSAVATPEQRHQTSRESLDYQRRPETDMEVCGPLQMLEGLARRRGIWAGLSRASVREQLRYMVQLTDELYPTFRWFLYDGRERYSAPLTVFGTKRAAIYLGQMYMVLNSSEHIQTLIGHFDGLIRAAIVQPPDVAELIDRLCDTV